MGGLALLAVGARALVYSATTIANLTGTIQALWAATLISFGFCLPLLAEALGHPFGSIWKRFDARCRFYPADTLPIQLLNSAILNLTLALPISSLMYRHRLPVGAQFRAYEVPILAAMALVLLAEPLLRRRLHRWQGAACRRMRRHSSLSRCLSHLHSFCWQAVPLNWGACCTRSPQRLRRGRPCAWQNLRPRRIRRMWPESSCTPWPAARAGAFSPHAAANMLTKPPVYGILCYAFLNLLACFHQIGEVSEWFKEAVLKTVGQQCPVGSNPTLSAIFFKTKRECRN